MAWLEGDLFVGVLVTRVLVFRSMLRALGFLEAPMSSVQTPSIPSIPSPKDVVDDGT